MSGNFQESSGGGDLDPFSFREKIEKNPGVVIDVRTPEEYQQGHLSDADYQFDLLSGEFEREMDNLDKDETYYLYCRSGARSGKAMEKMQSAGFKEVYNVGGYEELVSAGFPSNR